MPIYEYQCNRCDKEFEDIVSNAQDTPPCPSCGSADTRKLMSCACRSRNGDGGYDGTGYSSGGGGGCAGCSGGSCASCH